jgi:Uma2 family endonuclease
MMISECGSLEFRLVCVVGVSGGCEMANSQKTNQPSSVRTRQFTSDEFERLIETGILNHLLLLLSPLLAAQKVVIAVQNPILLDEISEPQPDLVIARFRSDAYRESLPTPPDILLLIEVADSSERYDRSIKIPLYAMAGIVETWLIDIQKSTIEVHRSPSPIGYREVRKYWGDEKVTASDLPEFSLAVSDLFPIRK